MEFQWPEHFQPSVVRSGFGAGTVSTHTLALEAWRRGLKVTFLAPSGKELEVSDGARTVRFDRSRAASEISEEAYSIVESKYDTTAALRAAGVPVPEAFALAASETTFEEVRAHAESLGYPVVLKPMRGSRGRGVFANIQSVEQLQEYYT
ncbi:hypothetical protein [Nesterenkonia sp. NBAIMH1]|uniref:ATP-binding protein n=1 Tax=Nesterenkonia sp. NBAIMH1 TaxID=2600320 RepID=UPI0011B4B801|nr:hypothetical protein [Nesterenkonia sp. NBAIMH1]